MTVKFSKISGDLVKRYVNYELSDDVVDKVGWLSDVNKWLSVLSDELGDNYKITDSENFILLSSEPDNIKRSILEFAEKSLGNTLTTLNSVAKIPKNNKFIIIVFDQQDIYLDYAVSYYDCDRSLISAAGHYLHVKPIQFIFPQQDFDRTEVAFALDLTRLCIHHLKLPDWLDEGLAFFVGCYIQQITSLVPNGRMQQIHSEFWNEDNIQEYWSGNLFYNNEQSAEYSRELSQIIVGMIFRNYEYDTVRKFILDVKYEDAGEQSSIEHLGVSLGDFVESFLEPKGEG